jgi:hypothetical protein
MRGKVLSVTRIHLLRLEALVPGRAPLDEDDIVYQNPRMNSPSGSRIECAFGKTADGVVLRHTQGILSYYKRATGGEMESISLASRRGLPSQSKIDNAWRTE